MGEPLSRVEAILQNILGADNILVPPGSQVEEILQAIYYNTEYEKNPKSRVAEILLAIKNKGVYYGPVLSRVEDILVHKLNGIPYTKHKKEDLSRVEQLLLDWLEQGGGEEIVEYTGTFPMTILANGEPLLDYLISGNTVQSGTPTPDNPVMPEGTGERTGNLFSSVWEQGSINGTTGQNEQSSLRVRTAEYIEVSTNKIYSFSRSVYNQYMNVRFYSADKSFIGTGSTSTIRLIAGSAVGNPMYAGDKFCCFEIIDPNIKYMRISDQSNDLSTRYMMVEDEYTEQTMPEYEPYGYKLDISSASTTTPIYPGEVETTRRIRKLVLTGDENWSAQAAQGGYRFVLLIQNTIVSDTSRVNSVCSHFPLLESGGTYTKNLGYTIVNSSIYLRYDPIETVADFKAFVAAQYASGTPVTVWYVLTEPETAVVNEPLMRIGDYADTLSYAQAGADVPTNKKPTETVIDVLTSVKPSEGYIKYTEPTDGPTPKTQVLGTKDHEIYMTSNDEVYVLRR